MRSLRRKSSRPASKKAKLPLLTAMEQAQLERDYEHFMEERALYEEMLEKGYRNNPRRARRNGTVGTALALATGFGAGVFAEKKLGLYDEFSRRRKQSAKSKTAPKAAPVTDAKWRIERGGGYANHMRRMGGIEYIVFKSKGTKSLYYTEYIPEGSSFTKRIAGPDELGRFSSKADAIAAAEAHAGRAKSNPRRARRNRGSAQTQTAAFKRWFGDSKVVDENGQPKVVYHGTQSEPFYTFQRPEKRRGMDLYGPGFYFTTHQKTLDTFGNRVMPVYLRIENPVKGMSMTPTQIRKFWDAIQVTKFSNGYDATEDHARIREHMLDDPANAFSRIVNNVSVYFNAEDARQAILAAGIDGVIIQANALGIDEYVVFDPRQIKSATENVGTFDPENADIRYNPRRRR